MDSTLFVAAALAVLGLLVVAAGLFGRALADVGEGLRASLVEAGERTAERAVEFCEWLRLGR
jgi:hypothetical protein